MGTGVGDFCIYRRAVLWRVSDEDNSDGKEANLLPMDNHVEDYQKPKNDPLFNLVDCSRCS